MAITYVGKGVFKGGADALSVSPPVGTQEGDLIILDVASSGVVGTVTGYIPIGDSFEFSGTTYKTRSFYKIAGASEGSVSVGDWGVQYAIMIVFRGVDPDNPIDAYTQNKDEFGTAKSHVNPTSTKDGCMLVNSGGIACSAGAKTTNVSSLANTSLVSITGYNETFSSSVGVAFSYGIKASAGAINDTTFELASSLNDSGMTNILLSPIPVASSGFFAFL